MAIKVTAILALCVLASCILAANEKIQITKLIRSIDLKGKYASITYDIDIETSSPLTVFQHAVPASSNKNLMDILAFGTADTPLKVKERTDDPRSSLPYVIHDISLQSPMTGKFSLRIVELFKSRLTPKPKSLPLTGDPQKVEFIDNVLAFTVYPTKIQETLVIVPETKRIEYHTPTKALLDSKKHAIIYGPFAQNQTQEELRVHYELQKPLIYFQKVQRQIMLSHLGHIEIHESFDLMNDAASLQGEFSRINYNQLSQMGQGGHILRKIHAQLPRKAFGLYYSDIIGNISTSVASRELNYVYFEAQPRFPVLGGWQTKWSQGYNLLNKYYIKFDASDPELYIFNHTFGYSFKKIYANNYQLQIILPPGASDIKVYLPFEATITEEEHRSYLDIEARKVISITKENMHSFYAKNFIVTYRLTARKMYEKVIMLIAFFLIFYATFILCSRFKFSLK